MSKSVAQQWRVAVHVERELVSLLSDKAPPSFEDVENLINQLRSACEIVIFLDFEYAHMEGIERRLWEAHTKINQRYRKIVDHYRGAEYRKHVVERRKLEKRYADFLKTSQFFYKGYVQRLASHFVGMKDLRRIAHRLSLSTTSVDERVKVPSNVERLIDLSCHATLLRLGDLSRYRNNLRSKERSWEPALGYYGLANDLFPEDGSAHNQMAVIALSDANHLDAVYHLYRALAIENPHQLAKGNLEIEFKKIATAWDKQRSQPQTDSLSTLIWWFLLLHSKYYEGVEFSTRQELEKEVLSRLALLLKEQTFDHVLEKLVLINIAAESFAGQKIREANGNHSPESICSFYFCFDFNIRMMSTLLQVLQPELKPNTSSGENLPNDDSPIEKTIERITTVIRRVLPALRQYSMWLVSQVEVVVAKLDRGSANFYANELWKIYADVLTKLATVFPPERLPSLNYLLEEDENTIGFKPLRDREFPHECNPYTLGPEGNLKSRIADQGVERHLPNEEMKARVRDILLCGLVLQGERYPAVPIVLRDGTFVHTEEQPSARISTPVQSRESDYLPNVSNRYGSYPNPPERVSTSQRVVLDDGTFLSDPQNNIGNDMHRFVDDLVGPAKTKSAANETSYGMHSMTANEVFFQASSQEVKPRNQSNPNMLPSLPGIWPTPFTPQLNELQQSSPTHPNLGRTLSPLGLATPQQRMAAAAHLDQVTGFRTSPIYSWGENNSGPQLKPLSPTRNNFLQEQLVRSSVPLTLSSDFPDNSSIYVNTPIGHHRSNKGRGINANKSTFYPDARDLDTEFMLQSSLFPIGSQRRTDGYSQTPPGGQGG